MKERGAESIKQLRIISTLQVKFIYYYSQFIL